MSATLRLRLARERRNPQLYRARYGVMPPFERLSPRERDVASLTAIGLSIKEVAEALGLAIGTVATHRDSIKIKTGTRNSVELARLAIREGFVSMHDEEVHDEH